MWPRKYWKQTLPHGEEGFNYFTTSNREEEDSASSNTSCTEITEEEYDAAQQAQRA